MIEKEGYIWHSDVDVICILTDNVIDENGELGMKNGIALEAKQTDSNVARYFGNHIIEHGNTPCLFIRSEKPHFCSLPTKYTLETKFNMGLIDQSVKLMLTIVNRHGFTKIALPRPGCENNELDWETEVKPVIESYLDDRFIVYNPKSSNKEVSCSFFGDCDENHWPLRSQSVKNRGNNGRDRRVWV